MFSGLTLFESEVSDEACADCTLDLLSFFLGGLSVVNQASLMATFLMNKLTGDDLLFCCCLRIDALPLLPPGFTAVLPAKSGKE